MNIAMVHPHDIYSSFEPWTVRVVALAKTFAQKGHTVKIIYFPLSREPASLKEICPRVVAIPFCRRAGIHHLIFNIIKLWDIARWAEIIHIQKCFYHAAVPAIVSARLASKPLHYDWDDWETKIFELSTSGGIFRNFIRAYINFLEIMIPKVVDTISVASVRLEQECKKRGIDEKRIFKARVGADGEKFNPALYGDSIKKRFSIR
ncbi:MAG: glycosyltransferase, partial [Candidatus Omnitrophica bacterium]|nr:glycosyltransferase [Candidatus Omnitrophota bacterium]